MKKLTVMLLAAAMLVLLVCVSASADATVPTDIRKDLQKVIADGYDIVDYRDPGGSYGFVLLQNANGNAVLYGYRFRNNGTWTRWMSARNSVPQNGNVFFVDYRGNNEFEIATEVNGHWTEQALYKLNKSGLWVLTEYWNEAKGINVTFSNNKITYIGEDDVVIGSATGTIQRDVRYVNLNNIPATLKAARNKYTSAPDIPEGSLEAQEIQFTGGKKYAVYTGPGESYVRANNNKAAVSTNDWIQVFGREYGWIMIQYHLNSAGQMRIGWIQESALPKNANVDDLMFDSMEVVVSRNTYVTDDPLGKQGVLMTLQQGETVTWLATMGEWAYIEQWNGAEIYRGFIPLQDMEILYQEATEEAGSEDPEGKN